jgi:hypothetical protein
LQAGGAAFVKLHKILQLIMLCQVSISKRTLALWSTQQANCVVEQSAGRPSFMQHLACCKGGPSAWEPAHDHTTERRVHMHKQCIKNMQQCKQVTALKNNEKNCIS